MTYDIKISFKEKQDRTYLFALSYETQGDYLWVNGPEDTIIVNLKETELVRITECDPMEVLHD